MIYTGILRCLFRPTLPTASFGIRLKRRSDCGATLRTSMTCGSFSPRSEYRTCMENVDEPTLYRKSRRIYALSLLSWSPYGIGQTIIFSSCGFFFFLLSFFPRLISAVAEWMSAILAHMVWRLSTNLRYRSETCCNLHAARCKYRT